MILYTPLDDTFTFISTPADGNSASLNKSPDGRIASLDKSPDGKIASFDKSPDGRIASFGKKAIAFTGDDDPWVGREKSRISALCQARGIPCTVIPKTNHSLESGDVFSDLKELYRIMEETERFIVGANGE